MDAKQYLQQIFFLKHMIKDNLQELEKLKEISTSLRGVFHRDNTTVILEKEITERIEEFQAKKREIENLIGEVNDSRLKTILLKRYVHLKHWETISDDLEQSYRNVSRLHNKALKEFETLYNCKH